ncbi:unnamed protein product [Prorocentrum cordatum]|uniref:Uncharacterized protein n=1 Tax=Prorocentrum cordatum TaxID=2364126 RepID=A0ABN9RIE6_9DINO|nr:unnamed protein product [Polarella glacialis]
MWASNMFACKTSDPDIVQYVVELPKVTPSTDTQVASKRVRALHCIQRVIDAMFRDPSLGDQLWRFIDARLVERAPTPSVQPISNLYATVKVSCELSLPSPPTKLMLEKTHDRDGMAINDMFGQHFQVNGPDKIPSGTPVNVLIQAMRQRAIDVGCRREPLFERAVNDDGLVGWGVAPLFTFECEYNRLARVTHVPSGDVAHVPADGECTINFDLQVYSWDAVAKFTRKNSLLIGKDWFPAMRGPNAWALDQKGEMLTPLIAAIKSAFERRFLDLHMLVGRPEDAGL